MAMAGAGAPVICPKSGLRCNKWDRCRRGVSLVCQDAKAGTDTVSDWPRAKGKDDEVLDLGRELGKVEADQPQAPRITKAWIEGEILSADYLQGLVAGLDMANGLDLGTTTICVMKLRNGITIVGTSACVSDANFDAAIGRELAYDDAVRQIWPLEGYLLASQLKAARR